MYTFVYIHVCTYVCMYVCTYVRMLSMYIVIKHLGKRSEMVKKNSCVSKWTDEIVHGQDSLATCSYSICPYNELT